MTFMTNVYEFSINDFFVCIWSIINATFKYDVLKLSILYFEIDQHLARHVYDVECHSSPPPFLCSQIITPFTTNQEKGWHFNQF